jgi:hypothetical protein
MMRMMAMMTGITEHSGENGSMIIEERVENKRT